jgi:translation initiation factor 2 beta subunit (eIF-2beta)/eIF-5
MDNFYPREYIVEITLQTGEYKGTIKQKTQGYCFGLDILNRCSDFESMYLDELYENNCNLELLGEDEDENEWFRCVLKSENSEEIIVEDMLRYIGNYVVKLEIIDCKVLK